MESPAGAFWSAPNNGLIYLTSPPLRLYPAKNNQLFSLSWEFSFKTLELVVYFLLEPNTFRWQNLFFLPCTTNSFDRLPDTKHKKAH